jgi:hypothetical protein
VGILLAVFCCLAWGAADFLGGSASNGRPALLVVLLAQAFGLLTAMVAAISWGVTRGIVKTCGSRSLRDHDLGVIVGRLFD